MWPVWLTFLSTIIIPNSRFYWKCNVIGVIITNQLLHKVIYFMRFISEERGERILVFINYNPNYSLSTNKPSEWIKVHHS